MEKQDKKSNKIPEIKIGKLKPIITKKPLRRFEEEAKEESKEEETELESIVEKGFSQIKVVSKTVSPTLELSESSLESQVSSAPVRKEGQNENEIENAPAYEGIKYSSSSGDYKSLSYTQTNFQSSSSLSMGSPQSGGSFMIKPQSPFDTPGYPKPNERNYESSIDTEKEKKRRRM